MMVGTSSPATFTSYWEMPLALMDPRERPPFREKVQCLEWAIFPGVLGADDVLGGRYYRHVYSC
jgi:hypothetical protein